MGTAQLEGYCLAFKGREDNAYATIEKKEGSCVPVLVWDISEQDERNLDRYEGYPVFYQKKILRIVVGEQQLSGMVYIMDERNRRNCPSSDYYGILEKAYQKYGFDSMILNIALQESKPVKV